MRTDPDLARHLVRAAFDERVDLAFSDECDVDHSFTMPLSFLWPEQDLPPVPFFGIVMVSPMPPATRCRRSAGHSAGRSRPLRLNLSATPEIGLAED